MANCILNTAPRSTVIEPTADRPRQHCLLRNAVAAMLDRLHLSDSRRPTAIAIRNALDASERASRAGCEGTAAALRQSAERMACSLAGGWSL